jgi:hypothetical protein
MSPVMLFGFFKRGHVVCMAETIGQEQRGGHCAIRRMWAGRHEGELQWGCHGASRIYDYIGF